MSEEPTKDLPGQGTFEERVLAELGAIRAEFGTIHVELSAVRAEFGTIHVELGAVRAEQAAIRRDIAALDSRLTTLEERVDARLRETRPIWEAIQLSIERLDEKFDNVIRDLYEVRADVGLHDKRLRELERRLNT
jgi:chromosome segregation ATPase